MSFKSDTYQVFIASPSDLSQERLAVTHALREWNDRHAETEKSVLLPVKWETHLVPQICDRPQQAIIDQLLSRCDILIGLMWARAGTPTGPAESGTAEEFDSAAMAGKPCLVYFSERKLSPGEVDSEQLLALGKFRTRIRERAITGTFRGTKELTAQLENHLLQVTRSLKPTPTPAVVTHRPAIHALQLHHTSLTVGNLANSRLFYREVLGLNEIRRPRFDFDGAWFELPTGQQIHLVKRDRRHNAPHYRLNHVAFRVANFDAAYDWLQDRCAVERFDTLPTGIPQLYIKDPDENVIEINSAETIARQQARRRAVQAFV